MHQCTRRACACQYAQDILTLVLYSELMMMSIRRLTSAWNWNFSLEDSMAARSESENDPALQNQATTYDLIIFCNMPNHRASLWNSSLASGQPESQTAHQDQAPMVCGYIIRLQLGWIWKRIFRANNNGRMPRINYVRACAYLAVSTAVASARICTARRAHTSLIRHYHKISKAEPFQNAQRTLSVLANAEGLTRGQHTKRQQQCRGPQEEPPRPSHCRR